MTSVDKSLQSLARETRRAKLEGVVFDLCDQLARGDLEAVLKLFAPDCVYHAPGAWTAPPFVRSRADREEFAEAFRLYVVEFEELGSQIHELLIEDERVAFHRTIRMRGRGTGDAIDVDMWHHMQFRDGLIVESAVYFDMAKFRALQPADAALR